jgi:tetratricopeptide (TPR) repeat protein
MGYYWSALAAWASGSGRQGGYVDKAVALAGKATPKERLYILGLKDYIGQEPKKAAAVLKKLIKRYPDEKQAYHMLGMVYFDGIGDLVQAAEYFNKTIEVDPLYKEPYNALAYCYSRLGDLDRAMWALDRYAALAPNEPNPYDSKGDVLAENGDIQGAIASYRMALEVRPDFAASLFKLGAAYVTTDQFTRADSCYRALASFPERQTRSDARAGFSQIAIRQGRLAEALRILDEAAASDRMEGYERGLVSEYTRRAVVLSDLGRTAAALAEFEKAAALADRVKPDEKLFESVSYVYFLSRAGDLKKADEVARKMKRTAGDKGEIIREMLAAAARGTVEFHKGNYQASSEQFAAVNSLIDKYGNSVIKSPYIPVLSGRAFLGRGAAGEAATALEGAVSRYYLEDAGSLSVGVQAHYYLGTAYEQLGDRNKAVRQYEEFLRIWKNADPGMKTVEDAKSRLARLQSLASISEVTR